MVSGAHRTDASPHDLLLFPEGDGLRHEIIDGIHYVTPSPSRHQDLVGRLYLAIGNFLATRPGIGRIFLSPLDVVFTTTTSWSLISCSSPVTRRTSD